MKTKMLISKKKNLIITGLFIVLLFIGIKSNAYGNEKKSIKIALLLDTSNSMDGLIEQAKSQLWTIVNELSKARCDGEKPDLQIALYEYGNDGLSPKEGYIRQVIYLTKDLDMVSQKLFELRTNGGNEFCGQVINSSMDQLEWNASKEDLKLIFIAGNEPFTQGSVDFRDACYRARNKDIIVNTIYCGDFNEGVRTSWKKGSDITGGKYMSINQNCKTVYISSPYDDRISELNENLNDTYISYGKLGIKKKENQIRQDANAGSISKVNAVKRSVSKASYVYKNESWDLVDASEQEDFDIKQIKDTELPQEMKGMSETDKVKYIESRKIEREQIQKEILALNAMREEYVHKQQAEKSKDSVLDDVMLNAIKIQANNKNFVFEN
ncbi:VWA domain-containing protein [Saccharicrinis sp. FJH62]|uniref:vWA domain-containing protein n=1 Tax=Saccharicrinis sp. FJH62 TaxID=3344657 RepID=UPI0035D4817F